MNENIPKLTLAKRDDEWWIIGIPNADVPEYGPYATKLLADEDRVGLLRTYRYEDTPGFVTVDKRRREKPKATTKPQAAVTINSQAAATKRRQTKLF